MGVKGEITNALRSWDVRNCNKNDKDGTVAVYVSKPRKLNGHTYKEWVKSLVKAKGSDTSSHNKSKLSQSEVNVTEANSSNEDETTNADSSFSHSQQERVDFLLRRIPYSGVAAKSNASNHVPQTKLQKRKNSSEGQCSLEDSKLQEKLACSVADQCKSSASNFVEYWVPVRLSNVQIEQYCGSVFSNSGVLCSSLKHDPVEILHEILVSIRKCCDHPYLVDRSLCTYLTLGIPGPEQLDAEIKLSGKLLLLHKILLEISARGLRVLILYQSLGGSGSVSTGDILDDIIHHKFGGDSFIRIDGGIPRSKKREALNSFNDEGNGKFFCLMETRACVPSVKLTSVDTVILFNSDWDPMNDLRALQKIKLDSQFEQVKVFRLYSAYTVEEKVLMLAKQGMTPEGNLVNMKRSTCHGLLTWGAYYLFEKLDEFHNFTSDTHSVISYGDSFVEDVFLELSNLLPKTDKSNAHTSNSLLSEVQQVGGIYPRNISLLGEVEYPLMDNFSVVEEMMVEEPPYVFWINLLEGRNPRWKFFSSQSSRIRKPVQRLDDLVEAPVKASKKRRAEARRTRNELQSQDKERKRSGRAAALTKPEATQGDPSSTDPYSLVPLEGHDQMPSSTTIQNDHPHETTGPSFTQAATYPLIEDSVRQLESSLEHSIGEVPMQTANIVSNMNEDRREPSVTCQTSVPLTSLNCQPPEASQVTNSEVLQSVCRAFQIELERLQNRKTESLKQHEDMKLQMKKACEKEIDQIKKKYEMALLNEEMAFVKEKEVLETRYNKVFINKALIEAMIQRENSEDALMQTENSENATLSLETTNCLMEEVRQLMAQWPRPSTMARPEQVAEKSPITIPTVRSTNAETNLAATQASAGHGMNGLSMDLTSSRQVPQASPDLCLSAIQRGPKHNYPVTLPRNLQAGCQMRAPAPHLRHMLRSLPSTAPKPSSQGPEVTFSPVNLQQVTSNVQTRQSLA